MKTCPCGLKCGTKPLDYLDCCGKYIEKGEPATSPEALMRSRYTAFSLLNLNYLQNTQLEPLIGPLDANISWIKLDVLDASQEYKKQATVTFKAYYKLGLELNCLHEKSHFQKIGGNWIYTTGFLIK